MLMPSPAEIRFDCMCDLIDYTCRGFPPTKKNFDELMLHIQNPDQGQWLHGEVFVPSTILPDDPETRAIMVEMLERVYIDRKKNIRNGIIIGASITSLVFAIFNLANTIQEERREAKYLESRYGFSSNDEVSCAG